MDWTVIHKFCAFPHPLVENDPHVENGFSLEREQWFVEWDFWQTIELSTIPPMKVENEKRNRLMAQFSTL